MFRTIEEFFKCYHVENFVYDYHENSLQVQNLEELIEFMESAHPDNPKNMESDEGLTETEGFTINEDQLMTEKEILSTLNEIFYHWGVGYINLKKLIMPIN